VINCAFSEYVGDCMKGLFLEMSIRTSLE